MSIRVLKTSHDYYHLMNIRMKKKHNMIIKVTTYALEIKIVRSR